MGCEHKLVKVELMNDNQVEFLEHEGDEKAKVKFSLSWGETNINSGNVKIANYVEANYCTECKKLFVEYQV